MNSDSIERNPVQTGPKTDQQQCSDHNDVCVCIFLLLMLHLSSRFDEVQCCRLLLFSHYADHLALVAAVFDFDSRVLCIFFQFAFSVDFWLLLEAFVKMNFGILNFCVNSLRSEVCFFGFFCIIHLNMNNADRVVCVSLYTIHAIIIFIFVLLVSFFFFECKCARSLMRAGVRGSHRKLGEMHSIAFIRIDHAKMPHRT